MKTIFKYLLFIVIGGLTISCASVKPYEKVYLNDEEMKLSARKPGQFESYFQIIREGASGAGTGKTGGGCGCN